MSAHDFAEEARRIHYVEAPERSIRGEASAEEYEALLEEGIEVFRWPSETGGSALIFASFKESR
jgi:hypothetical protein